MNSKECFPAFRWHRIQNNNNFTKIVYVQCLKISGVFVCFKTVIEREKTTTKQITSAISQECQKLPCLKDSIPFSDIRSEDLRTPKIAAPLLTLKDILSKGVSLNPCCYFFLFPWMISLVPTAFSILCPLMTPKSVSWALTVR